MHSSGTEHGTGIFGNKASSQESVPGIRNLGFQFSQPADESSSHSQELYLLAQTQHKQVEFNFGDSKQLARNFGKYITPPAAKTPSCWKQSDTHDTSVLHLPIELMALLVPLSCCLVGVSIWSLTYPCVKYLEQKQKAISIYFKQVNLCKATFQKAQVFIRISYNISMSCLSLFKVAVYI